jgi:hypothetical protein
MNSKRIIDDLDFVEENREINTRNNMSDDEAYKLRKLYTIYLTIYDMYYFYVFTSHYCNFNDLETEYKRSYNKNAIEMIKKTDINPILIHNYAYHMESLKRTVKLHYDKNISDRTKETDNNIEPETKPLTEEVKPTIPKIIEIHTEQKYDKFFMIIISISILNLFLQAYKLYSE